VLIDDEFLGISFSFFYTEIL